jgi:hypothetical protein
MATTDKSRLIDRVVDTAKRIEAMEDPDELDVLEVTVDASLDGTARAFTAVLTTGGPQIEVNVSKGTVTGYWASERHTTHVDNDDVLDALEFRYQGLWEANQ